MVIGPESGSVVERVGLRWPIPKMALQEKPTRSGRAPRDWMAGGNRLAVRLSVCQHDLECEASNGRAARPRQTARAPYNRAAISGQSRE